MKWLNTFFAVAFTIATAGCSAESYPEIPPRIPIISTVNIKDMSISFFNMEEKKLLPDWKVDRPYIGGLILPDKDTFMLYGNTLDSVDLYSLSKGKKIASWDTGKGIVNAILVQDGKEVALADQERNSIQFYSLKGKMLNEIKIEKDPLTLMEAEKSNKLYVISFHNETLSIIDLNKKEIIPGFKIHAAAAGAFVSEQNDELWIGGHGKGTQVEEKIHVYDTRTGKLKNEISAPVMPVNFTMNEQNVFVLSHGSNMLYKLSKQGEMVNSIKIGANPFEMEFFEEKLIVAGYDSNELYIVDPLTLSVEDTLSVGNGPFQIVTRGR